MATEPMSYGIVNGPGREELFDALRLRSEQGPLNPRTTEFTLAASLNGQREEAKLPFVVNGIVDTETADVDYILYLDGGQLGRLRAIYNVQRRRGRLERIASAEDRVHALKKVIGRISDFAKSEVVAHLKVPPENLYAIRQIISLCNLASERIFFAENEEVLQEAMRQLEVRK